MKTITGLPNQVTLSGPCLDVLRDTVRHNVEETRCSDSLDVLRWRTRINLENIAQLEALDTIEADHSGIASDPVTIQWIRDAVMMMARGLANEGIGDTSAHDLQAWSDLEDLFGIDRRLIAIEMASSPSSVLRLAA